MDRNRMTPTRAARQGVALVTTLLVVSIVGVMVAGSLILSITNQRISRNDATASQAFYAAQAGNAYWRAELVSLYQFMIENFDLYEDAVNAHIAAGGSNISCGNYLAIGADLDRDGTPDVAPGRPLPPVQFRVGGQVATVRSTFDVSGSAIELDGRSSLSGGIGRVVERFTISNMDLWNNAVFAETGAANASIQGRAEIRGAIHILGQGLAPTDMALDVSGSFGLGNTYRNLSPSLGVNAAEMRLTQDDPQDLCAALRVRSGYVNLGGSSQIGYAEDTTASPYIDRMRGVYTNDGFIGGKEDENVFSENGMYAAYDAGNTFTFPGLDDDNGKGASQTYAQALEANALVLALKTGSLLEDDRLRALDAGDDEVYAVIDNPSAVSLDPGSSYVSSRSAVPDGRYYLVTDCYTSPLFGVTWRGLRSDVAKNTKKNNNSSTGELATGFVLQESLTQNFHCQKWLRDSVNGDRVVAEIDWNGTDKEIYLGGDSGVVMLKGGDLLISGANNKEIGYFGEGILFVEQASDGTGGNVELEVDVLPAERDAAVLNADGSWDFDAPDPDFSVDTNSYPATTVLGIVARDTIKNAGSQKRFTAALYADQSVSVSKQTLVAGAIVTRTFDAGSQVPTVLYVPNLAERLPDLMPGAGGEGFAVSNVSFSRQ